MAQNLEEGGRAMEVRTVVHQVITTIDKDQVPGKFECAQENSIDGSEYGMLLASSPGHVMGMRLAMLHAYSRGSSLS